MHTNGIWLDTELYQFIPTVVDRTRPTFCMVFFQLTCNLLPFFQFFLDRNKKVVHHRAAKHNFNMNEYNKQFNYILKVATTQIIKQF